MFQDSALMALHLTTLLHMIPFLTDSNTYAEDTLTLRVRIPLPIVKTVEHNTCQDLAMTLFHAVQLQLQLQLLLRSIVDVVDAVEDKKNKNKNLGFL